MLRADMDALPFASKLRQKDRDGVEQLVMHACGHDIHIVALLAAAECFASGLSSWFGTLILVLHLSSEEALIREKWMTTERLGSGFREITQRSLRW